MSAVARAADDVCAMPELQQDGLDVSAEEVRYLRRVFRRFSLPYLAVILALAGFVAWKSAVAPTTVDSTAAELETLVAEAASVREAVASVRDELRDELGQSDARLDALERSVEKLSSAVAAVKSAKPRQVAAPSGRIGRRRREPLQRGARVRLQWSGLPCDLAAVRRREHADGQRKRHVALVYRRQRAPRYRRGRRYARGAGVDAWSLHRGDR